MHVLPVVNHMFCQKTVLLQLKELCLLRMFCSVHTVLFGLLRYGLSVVPFSDRNSQLAGHRPSLA